MLLKQFLEVVFIP